VQSLAERSVTGLPPIAAMTTDAERECYYRLAKEAAGEGTIVELGAWMGASTAYIAAGIRDSGVEAKAHVYDKFESKPGHIGKVKAFYDKHGIDRIPVGPCLQTFKDNLGPLLEYVEPHPGQIEQMRWGKEPISLLVTDAPKRVPAISAVLTTLRNALQPGALMAWQDFCHFPSYEIPACLYRLRDHLEFVEAVVPGTTLVFRVKSQWNLAEVTQSALALSRWTPEEINEAWGYWQSFVPREKQALFECGACMFLCDTGNADFAVPALALIHAEFAEAILPKWRYLKEARPDFRARYAPLFKYLESQGAL
jgi:predicted O-methyltransferase YrrM